MNSNEVKETIKEEDLTKEIKNYYKQSAIADKLMIITGIIAIITFLTIIAVNIIDIVESNNSRRINDLSSRIERIEKDNVYRDEVINQTRSELNF